MEPIRDLNAIDQVIFALEMTRSFSDAEIGKLIDIGSLFTTEEFPTKNNLQSAGVMMSPEGVQLHPQKLSGIELTSAPNNHGHKIFPERPDWQVIIELQMIKIHCLNYTRWNDVSDKAINYLFNILELIADSDNEIDRIVLQYNDLFVYEGKPEDYNVYDLFTDSDFLPNHIKTSGSLWHVHQGWFEKNNLNVLNISTRKNQNEHHLSIIEHIQKKPINNPISTLNKDQVSEIFLNLHRNNKKIIDSLIIEEMKHKIGLNNA